MGRPRNEQALFISVHFIDGRWRIQSVCSSILIITIYTFWIFINFLWKRTNRSLNLRQMWNLWTKQLPFWKLEPGTTCSFFVSNFVVFVAGMVLLVLPFPNFFWFAVTVEISCWACCCLFEAVTTELIEGLTFGDREVCWPENTKRIENKWTRLKNHKYGHNTSPSFLNENIVCFSIDTLLISDTWINILLVNNTYHYWATALSMWTLHLSKMLGCWKSRRYHLEWIYKTNQTQKLN